MLLSSHYIPAHTETCTADKATIRLLLAMTVDETRQLRLYNITSAHTSQLHDHHKPVHVKQMMHFAENTPTPTN